MGHRPPPSAGRTTRQGDRKQRKIREVLVEQSCYLVDGPGATIAAIDDTVPDNDADSNEDRRVPAGLRAVARRRSRQWWPILIWYRGADNGGRSSSGTVEPTNG